MKIGYARVSTRDGQSSASQRQLLAEAGCDEIYIDEGTSGRTAARPELDKALARLRPGDTLADHPTVSAVPRPQTFDQHGW